MNIYKGDLYAYLKKVKYFQEYKPNEAKRGQVEKELSKRSQKKIEQIYDALNSRSYIEVNQNDGTLSVSPSGQKFLESYKRFLGWKVWKEIVAKKIIELRNDIKIKYIILTFIFFLSFYILKPFIDSKITVLFYEPILKSFEYSTVFSICLLSISVILILYNYKRNLVIIDIIIFGLYVWYRWVDHYWIQENLFNGLNLIKYCDVVLIYYCGILTCKLLQQEKRRTLVSFYEHGVLYPDLPLHKEAEMLGKNISDVDTLNRSVFAREMAEVIGKMRPKHAFTVGISGPWGSGKTSLMELIKEELKQRCEHHVFIDFSPWYFGSSETLITSFFSLLESKARITGKLASELKSYAKALQTLEKSFLKTELVSSLFAEEIPIKERFESISKQIEYEGLYFIIFVDDLDRMESQEIISVLRLIRLIANFPNTFYFVGYDKNYVTEAIREHLTKHEASRYLDKIFNVEFKIPETNVDVIKERVRSTVEAKLGQLTTKNWQIDPKELNLAFDYHRTATILKHERDVKRFSNNLLIRLIPIKNEVNFYHLFLLELINFKRSDLTDAIYSSGGRVETLIDHTKADFSSENRIVADLFSDSSKSMRASICDELFFYRYFSLNLAKGTFTIAEFNDAFSKPIEELQSLLTRFTSQNLSLLNSSLQLKMAQLRGEVVDDENTEYLVRAFLDLYRNVSPYYMLDLPDEKFNRFDFFNIIYELLWKKDKVFRDALISKLTTREIIGLSCFCMYYNLSNLKLDANESNSLKKEFMHFHERIIYLAANRGTPISEIRIYLVNACQFAEPTGDVKQIDWYKEKILRQLFPILKGSKELFMDEIIKKSTHNATVNFGELRKEISLMFPESIHDYLQKENVSWVQFLYNGYILSNSKHYKFERRFPADLDNPQPTDNIYSDTIEIAKYPFIILRLNPQNIANWKFVIKGLKTNPERNETDRDDAFSYIELRREFEIDLSAPPGQMYKTRLVAINGIHAKVFGETDIPNYLDGTLFLTIYKSNNQIMVNVANESLNYIALYTDRLNDMGAEVKFLEFFRDDPGENSIIADFDFYRSVLNG